jgi:hypothetical protein
MFIKQLSVFVENKPGRLHAIVDALAKSGVNLRALSVADTTDFGILRVITDDNDKAQLTLREMGVISKSTDVIAVTIDDQAGGLASVLDVVSSAGVGIEYMYAFLGRTHGKAMMVIKTDGGEKAAAALAAKGVTPVDESEI